MNAQAFTDLAWTSSPTKVVALPIGSPFHECGVAAGGLDTSIVGLIRGYACRRGFQLFMSCSYRLAQSARRGYMRHDSCHIGQNNLKDGHSEVMGRRSIGPKEDPRAAAKSPSAKATPTRPLSLTTRSNTQISLRPRQPPREHRSSRLKQRKNQLSTKDPLRKAACAKPLDAHRCRHRRP